MTKYKKYKKYKKTNIDWLGEIPSHWEQTQIKAIARTSVIKNKPKEELLSVYREYGVIPKNSRDDNHNADGKDLSTYKYVSKNNLVVNKMKAWQGSMGVSDYNGIISPAYIVCKLTDNVVAKYVHYLLRSKYYIDYYNQISYGVRVGQWDMRYGDFKNLPFFIPPLEEQNKIVYFIKFKENQINKLIKKTKKLIELLEEKKKIIITEAVTKGLDKSIPMKDSGIDYIGYIPKHWEIRKLKFITTKNLQYGANETGIDYAKNRPRYVRITDIDISKNILKDDDKLYLDEKIAKPYLLTNGDILLARSGATVGKSFIYKDKYGKCAFAGYLIRAIINKKLMIPDFFYSYTLSRPYDLWKNKIFIQATIQNIGADKYSNLQVPIPSIDKQKLIVEYVNSIIEKFNKLIDKQVILIEKLEEYKKVLISNAVTGQIDVRDYEIPETDDNINLEETDIISEDDIETINEVEYANN